MAIRQFFGTHENKLDAKNRMSIPASFRAVIRDLEAQKLIMRKSLRCPCIEAWPDVSFADLLARLDQKDVFSAEHDDLAWEIYAGAMETEPDKDGRVILPPDLVSWAGLTDAVSVVGLGKRFEIWDRAAAKERSEARLGRPPLERGSPAAPMPSA